MNKFKDNRIIWIGAPVAIFFVWIIWYNNFNIICYLWPDSYIPSDANEIGDSFGVINSLFSGLAFAGLIVAILLQRKELKLQREELKETREEFHEQTEIYQKQNELIKIQIENEYLIRADNIIKIKLDKLLKSIDDVVISTYRQPNNISTIISQSIFQSYDGSEILHKGKNAVRLYCTILKKLLERSDDYEPIISFYDDQRHYVRPIINGIFSILEFITTLDTYYKSYDISVSRINDHIKILLDNVLASFTGYELIILLYHVVYISGRYDMIDLIDRWDVLKMINKYQLDYHTLEILKEKGYNIHST